MKEILIAMKNWDFTQAIVQRNLKWLEIAMYAIDTIVAWEDNTYVVIFSNNKILHYTKNDTILFMLHALSQPILEPWSRVSYISNNEYTKTIRKWLDIQFTKTDDPWWKYIFSGYEFDGIKIYSKMVNIWSSSILYLKSNSIFVLKPREVELCQFDRERLVELCKSESDESEEELFVSNLFDKVLNLSFVKDVTVSTTKFSVQLKPYFMDFLSPVWWPSASLSMPSVWIDFYFRDKRYKIRLWEKCHPHVWSSWDICLWAFQYVVNKEWHNVELCVIQIYSLLTTHNPWSPYFWIFENLSTSAWCYYERYVNSLSTEDEEWFTPWVLINWEIISPREFHDKHPDSFKLTYN